MSNALTLQDRFAIHELVALYGHVIDNREWSRVGELFTADVLYDVSDFKGGVHRTAEQVRQFWIESASRHPLAHHSTNVLITQDAAGTVRVLSKGIGLRLDGKIGSVDYRDIVVPTAAGWRIAERVAIGRRAP